MAVRRHRPARLARGAALLGLLLAGAGPALGQNARELWLRAALDGTEDGLTVLVIELPDGSRLLRRMDLLLLGLDPDSVRARSHQGEWFVPVEGLARHQVRFDDVAGRIVIDRLPPARRGQRDRRTGAGWTDAAAGDASVAGSDPAAPTVVPGGTTTVTTYPAPAAPGQAAGPSGDPAAGSVQPDPPGQAAQAADAAPAAPASQAVHAAQAAQAAQNLQAARAAPAAASTTAAPPRAPESSPPPTAADTVDAMASTPPPAAIAPAAAAAAAGEGQAWLLDVTVNGRALPGVWLVHEAAGALSVGSDLLAAAGITPPPGHPAGAALPLAGLAVAPPRFDRGELKLAFEVAPERLAGQSIDLADDFRPGPPPRGLSAIASYDVGMSRASGADTIAGAALDAAVASGRTTCSAGVVLRNEGRRTRRAETGCLVDFPERMISVGLGDGIGGDSALTPPVRYAGVRIGTDFALNPYFNTRPLVGVQGTARLPSTLELWLDQQLALRTELPPGPFDVSDLPAHTGNGELRAVITDALGRQSVIAAPVFIDPRLLRQGLLDWSAEAGKVRLDYLGEDDRYGERFARVGARRGMTSRLTVGAQAEVREDGGLVGVQAAFQLGERGLVEAAVAGSRNDGDDGHAWLLGYSYRGERWNVGLRHWQGEDAFSSLAYPEPGDAPSRFTQASVGVRVAASTSVSLAVFDRRQDGQPDQQLAHLAVTLQPWHWAQLIVSASHSFGDDGDTRLGMFLSVPLGRGHTGSASVRHRDEGTRVTAAVQSPYPVGTGFGYRVEAAHESGNASIAGDTIYRGRAFQATAAGRHDGNGSQVQGGVTGSVVVAGGGVHFTRNEPGSYAVVQLPHAGVRVLRDHQTVAVTDADGVALVPGLRPFERNRVELAAGDLPLSALADVLAMELVPGRRQAVDAGFDVRELRYVAGRARLADGGAPPPGALVDGAGVHGGSVVGFEGEIFLPLLPADGAQTINVRWPMGACAITVPALPAGTDVVHLEDLACLPIE